MTTVKDKGLLSNALSVYLRGYVLKGMVSIFPIMFSAIIIPEIITSLVGWGLNRETIGVAVVLIPALLISVILIPNIPHNINRTISIIIPYISGISLYLSALFLNLGNNIDNSITIIILSLTFFFNFVTSYYQFYFLKKRRVDLIFGKSLGKDYKIISYFTGLAIANLIFCAIYIVFFNIIIVLYSMATFSLIIPWIDIALIKYSKLNRESESDNLKIVEKINLKEPSPKIMKNHRIQLLSTIFLLSFLMMLYSLGCFIYNSQNFGWTLFGITVGLFFYREIRKYKFPGAMAASIGILCIYILFYINPTVITGEIVLFLIGLIMGVLFGDIYELFSNFKLKRVRKEYSFGLWFFGFLVSIAISSYFSNNLKNIIENNPELLWIGLLVIGISEFIILPFMFKIGKEYIIVEKWSKILEIKKRKKLQKGEKIKKEIDNSKTIIHIIPRKLVNICTKTSIISLCIFPIFIGILLIITNF